MKYDNKTLIKKDVSYLIKKINSLKECVLDIENAY